ncbi:MAG TPA: methyltransferase domain-containing protein [Longimicrobiaceae bacterium]|jgi:SAM-dependent methyltransferase|nr:methyltransferase domain-containing protein [Longimicrobiaceae bacterium]
MHKNSRLLFQKYAKPYFTPQSRVLEIGPDADPSTYRGLVEVEGPVAQWDTLDFAARTDVPLTYRSTSDYTFPVPDASYDIVYSAQVIEHVKKIWVWMRELARVCKPGGLVITINPVSWHYHESPVDCWRIYPEGMRALSDDAGLEVLLSEWGSVEMEGIEAKMPRLLRKQQVWQRLSGVLGMVNAVTKLPVEAAYDTVTVARKPV